MKQVSGKIDRTLLPDLSQLRGTVNSDRTEVGFATAAPLIAVEEELGAEEVLAICRSVFEWPIGWDDGFAEAGGHSIVIARLALSLQAGGWPVSVRALLTDCNTARKVAARARQVRATAAAAPVATNAARPIIAREETDAKVLSVERFTILQILFATLLYLPGLLLFLGVLGSLEIGSYFATAGIGTFIVVGIGLYLLSLLMPFATLLWVMAIKLLLWGDARRNNVTPGAYPKWSRMHLKVWCIGRMEGLVLLPLGAIYRSAPLMAFVLRQLGATVGKNLQCAHDAYLSGPLDLITAGDDVAIQTGAYVQTTRWSGQYLLVGPINLESGCKIGMRAAIANNVTVGRGTWITPFTPILTDVGLRGDLGRRSRARCAGRCTRAEAHGERLPDTRLRLAAGDLNVLMQIFLFFAVIVVPAPPRSCGLPAISSRWPIADLPGELLQGDAAVRDRLAPGPLHVCHSLGHHCRDLLAGLPLHSLDGRFAGAAPSRGLNGALLMYRMNRSNAIQGLWTWTITGQYLRALAGMRFPRLGASECDVMFNLVPEAASRRRPGFLVQWMFHEHARLWRRAPRAAPLSTCRGISSAAITAWRSTGQFPSNFLLGVSTPCSEIRFRRQMRSRPGEAVTVAGNPPVKFASASFEAENATHRPPTFLLFLTRILLNDFFSVGMLRVTEGLIFAVSSFVRCGLASTRSPGALVALLLTETGLVLLSVTIKQVLVGRRMGRQSRDALLVLATLRLLFRAGLLLRLVPRTAEFLRRHGSGESDSTPDGLSDRAADNRDRPMQCSDWNAVKLRQRLHRRRLSAVSHFRKHDAEGEANSHPAWLRHLFGCNGHGRRGHRAGHDGPALLTGPQRDGSAHGHLSRQPGRARTRVNRRYRRSDRPGDITRCAG